LLLNEGLLAARKKRLAIDFDNANFFSASENYHLVLVLQAAEVVMLQMVPGVVDVANN
jgi:hypothetical protein